MESADPKARTGAQSACQEIGADAENMGMEREDPKARRNAAESPTAVRRDVAGMLVKVKADSKMTRLGVDPNNFLNFEASTFEMFVASTRIMGCVLGVHAGDLQLCEERRQCTYWRRGAVLGGPLLQRDGL